MAKRMWGKIGQARAFKGRTEYSPHPLRRAPLVSLKSREYETAICANTALGDSEEGIGIAAKQSAKANQLVINLFLKAWPELGPDGESLGAEAQGSPGQSLNRIRTPWVIALIAQAEGIFNRMK